MSSARKVNESGGAKTQGKILSYSANGSLYSVRQ